MIYFDTEIIIKLRHQGFRSGKSHPDVLWRRTVLRGRHEVRPQRVPRRVPLPADSAVSCHPEFEEYWHRYPLKQADYSSHDCVRRTISSVARTDLGCGDGYLAEVIAADAR